MERRPLGKSSRSRDSRGKRACGSRGRARRRRKLGGRRAGEAHRLQSGAEGEGRRAAGRLRRSRQSAGRALRRSSQGQACTRRGDRRLRGLQGDARGVQLAVLGDALRTRGTRRGHPGLRTGGRCPGGEGPLPRRRDREALPSRGQERRGEGAARHPDQRAQRVLRGPQRHLRRAERRPRHQRRGHKAGGGGGGGQGPRPSGDGLLLRSPLRADRARDAACRGPGEPGGRNPGQRRVVGHARRRADMDVPGAARPRGIRAKHERGARGERREPKAGARDKRPVLHAPVGPRARSRGG